MGASFTVRFQKKKIIILEHWYYSSLADFSFAKMQNEWKLRHNFSEAVQIIGCFAASWQISRAKEHAQAHKMFANISQFCTKNKFISFPFTSLFYLYIPALIAYKRRPTVQHQCINGNTFRREVNKQKSTHKKNLFDRKVFHFVENNKLQALSVARQKKSLVEWFFRN